VATKISQEADRIIDQAAALEAGACCPVVEQRRQQRFDYKALVGLMLSRPGGSRSEPMVLRARDISSGGVSLLSSHPIAAGSEGVMQLVRSDGQFALVGVVARHCRYAGHMEHRTGFQFAPLPEGFRREDFLDEEGRLVLFDGLLRGNCRL
jgi:hypothetical protein